MQGDAFTYIHTTSPYHGIFLPSIYFVLLFVFVFLFLFLFVYFVYYSFYVLISPFRFHSPFPARFYFSCSCSLSFLFFASSFVFLLVCVLLFVLLYGFILIFVLVFVFVFVSSSCISPFFLTCFRREGGGAHARGRVPAAKSGRAPEVGPANQVHCRPSLPHHADVSSPSMETLRLG